VIKLLEWTGERIIPKTIKMMNGMLLEHIARYYFALPYIKGRALDIAKLGGLLYYLALSVEVWNANK
jgi:hypothetical protein